MDKILLRVCGKESEEDEHGSNRMRFFETFRKFMQPPFTSWWTRMWVVQEIVLAKKISVVYGTISALWGMVDAAARAYNDHRSVFYFESLGELQDQRKVLSDFSNRILNIGNRR